MAGHLKRLLLSLAVLLAGCASSPEYLPLPPLAEPVVLRVGYFHNPALPEPPPGFVADVLREAGVMMREHFGVAVKFAPAGEPLPIAAAFGEFDAQQLAGLEQRVYGFRGSADRARLVTAMRKGIARPGTRVEEVAAQVRAWLPAGAAPRDWDPLAEAMVDAQLSQLKGWSPLLASGPYHLFPAWGLAARQQAWPYELVITNQLVASAEYDWMELVTVTRAGVTNGMTVESRGGAHGLLSVLTLYPFIANDAHTLALRGGARGGGADAVRWAAALLVHELGHQLLHLNHPASPACVMYPPTSLRYAEWVAGLDPSRCALRSSEAMKPGSVRFIRLRPQ